MTKVKKIFVCCTEQSGDNIASNIFKKIKTNNNFIIEGVGGSKSAKYFGVEGDWLRTLKDTFWPNLKSEISR